jgi:magnesium-transporting ATPase (P-type)
MNRYDVGSDGYTETGTVGGVAWHALGAGQVLHSEGVDGCRGLSSAKAAARAPRSGPNELAAGKAEPPWHAFVRQYKDPMQIGLLAAGIVRDGELVGDPTEGALVVLAAKGGIDAVSTRDRYPRIAELPFDGPTS